MFVEIDPLAEQLSLRITMVTPGDTVNLVHLRRRYPDGRDSILYSIPYPEATTTVTTILTVFQQGVYSAADSNQLYVDIRSTGHPDGYMTGHVETVPSATTFEFNGAKVVPRVDGAGGHGNGYVVLDAEAHALRYYVSWTGLSGPPADVQLHLGPAGANGPRLALAAPSDGASFVVGSWVGLTAEDIAALRTGGMYLTVGTALHPDGEIRGQLVPTDVFTAALDPFNESPVVVSSFASGTGIMLLSEAPGVGMYTKVYAVVGDLDDTIQAAHVHRGSVGANGPVIVPLVKQRPFELTLERNEPAGTYDTAATAAIRAGNSYINVHTGTHQDGELRGQWVPAASNLSRIASVREPERNTIGANARWDAAANTIRCAIAPDARYGNRAHAFLYTAGGLLVGQQELVDNEATFNATGLASGTYFTNVVVDGLVAACCRVTLAR